MAFPKNSAFRFALVFGALLTMSICAGCGGSQPPPPTAADAAKQPTPPAPKGSDAARTADDR